MRRLSLLAAILAVGLSTSACDIKTSADGDFSFAITGGKAEDTWSRSYKIPADGRFELINVNGRITAESADGGDVIVEARRTAKARTDEAAKDMLAKLEIREEVNAAAVRVESRPPRMSGFGGHEIQWTVKVPKGVAVDLRTTNGGVRINGLTGKVNAKTTNGGVKGVNIIPSALEASSVNGGVEIELGKALDAGDSVEIETVNGGAVLAMPADSKATIAARAVNGGVRVSDLDIQKDTQANDFESRRRVNGTLNGGGARVNVSTTNGGVRISRTGSSASTDR